jgi:Carbohydrate binding domain
MGIDVTLDVPVDGELDLSQDWLNSNVRDPLFLTLSPPLCILQKTDTMSISGSSAWNALIWDFLIADTEDPDNPMFALTETDWDFEDATVQGWTAGDGSVVASTDVANSGDYSLKWTVTNTGTRKAIGPSISLSPTKTARGILWAYNGNATSRTVNAEIGWYDNTDTLLSVTDGATLSLASGEWARFVASGTAPASTDHFKVRFVAVATAADIYYVDDASGYAQTDPTKVTIQTPGWYEATADFPLTVDTANNSLSLAIRVNGTDYYAIDSVSWTTNTLNTSKHVTGATLIALDAADYLETVVRTTRATTLTSLAQLGAPSWSVRRLRGI